MNSRFFFNCLACLNLYPKALEHRSSLINDSTERGNLEGRCLEPKNSTPRIGRRRAGIIPARTLRLFLSYQDLPARWGKGLPMMKIEGAASRQCGHGNHLPGVYG